MEKIGLYWVPDGYSERERERILERYPGYKALYLRTFRKMIANRKEKGMTCEGNWATAESCFDWWLEKKEEDCKTNIAINKEDCK